MTTPENTWTDERLADHLEELLPPDDVARLEEALAADEGLRGRLAALRAVLAEPVELPAIAAPSDLPARTRARLEQAKLLQCEGAEGDALPSDALLADHLEGRLAPEDAAAVEAALSCQPAAQRRLEALRDVLREPVVLPPLTPPPGLAERILGAQEMAGLVFDPSAIDGDPDGVDVPDGLLAATLGRLEQEGLVAAAASGGGSVISFPAQARWAGALRFAAAVLISLGVGALAGAQLGDSPAVEQGESAELAALRQQVASMEAQSRAAETAPTELQQARKQAALLQAVLRAERAARVEEQARARQVAARLETRARQVARLTRQRDRLNTMVAGLPKLRSEFEQARAALGRTRRKPVKPVQDPALLARLRSMERTIARLKGDLRVKRRTPGAGSLAAAMEVSEARGVDLWVAGSWKGIPKKATLSRHALVRARGSRHTLIVAGMPCRLQPGKLYRITGPRRLELVEERVAPRGAKPVVSIPELIRQLASSSRTARSAAQDALTDLYYFYRKLDPGPGIVSVANDLAGRPEAEGPPTAVEGWRAWWIRVQPHLPLAKR